jgi:hypothetical protein
MIIEMVTANNPTVKAMGAFRRSIPVLLRRAFLFHAMNVLARGRLCQNFLTGCPGWSCDEVLPVFDRSGPEVVGMKAGGSIPVCPSVPGIDATRAFLLG